MYRVSQNTMINNEDLKNLYENFCNNCYKKYSNSDQYNFNLLDEQCGSIKENSHTNILMKLLEYKNQYGYVFLEDFISSLTDFEIKIEDDVRFETEYFDRTDGKQGRIDGLIYQKEKLAIILENKVNRASNQKDQLKRYIESVIGNGEKKEKIVDIENVYVIFLTQSGVEDPDDESRDYMQNDDIGILNTPGSYTDETEPLSGPRYFACSYSEHILPWLEERVQPIVMQKEIMLYTGLVQYIDFLKGMLNLREGQTKLQEESVEWFNDNVKIDESTLKKQNTYLKDLYVKLPRLAKKQNEEGYNDSVKCINLLRNIVMEKAEEPMANYLNKTKEFISSIENPLIPEKDLDIRHTFDFYCIIIRNKNWPKGYEIGWIPFNIGKNTAKLYYKKPNSGTEIISNDVESKEHKGFYYNGKNHLWQTRERNVKIEEPDDKDLKILADIISEYNKKIKNER